MFNHKKFLTDKIRALKIFFNPKECFNPKSYLALKFILAVKNVLTLKKCSNDKNLILKILNHKKSSNPKKFCRPKNF